MRKYFFRSGIIIAGLFIFLVACNSTKYIPDGKYLLIKNELKADQSVFSQKEFQSYFRQRPNKKIFGFWRFHMGLYNISNPAKESGFHNWLRSIGEEPIVYEPNLSSKSISQLYTFLNNKGFYHSVIHDSLIITGRKAKLRYDISLGEPYVLDEIEWTSDDLISDSRIADLIRRDSLLHLIKSGDRFDSDVLRQERIRISNLLREIGYYDFSKEYIHFVADTFAVTKTVNLKLGIKQPTRKEVQFQQQEHQRFRIRNISIISDFNPKQYMQSPDTYFLNSDTVQFGGLDYIYNEKLSVKRNLLHSSIYIMEGELFSQSKVDKTHTTLNGLQNFRIINLLFEPVDSVGVDSIQLLDCKIELTPLTKQSYDIAIEGTHSSGNLGMAGNLIYKHRNLFHGAENFELRFKGAIEFLTNSNNDFNRMIEYGVVTRLNVPQFWLPIKLEALQKRYSPRTMLSFNYNYQSRPEITRTIAAAGFGYHWKSSRFFNHQINMIDLNYVNVTEMSERFREIISGTYLEDSYRSHVISAFNYSFTYSNQKLNKQRNFFFASFRPEVAGSLFSIVYGMSGSDRPEGGYLFFDTPYSQYFMADVDLRYYRVMNDANRFVFRVFAGAGYPFGNAEVMPFEKRYFSGGSNGIRAWQVRSLGPGSYILPADREDLYPNQLGDIKLEANFEYRFDLFLDFKGAVFLDAGNIWAIKYDLDQPGAEFSVDRFYNEIAVGTGFGLRLDLSFFVARLDLGMKLRDPGMTGGPGWIPFTRTYGWEDFMLNFAIGYPF